MTGERVLWQRDEERDDCTLRRVMALAGLCGRIGAITSNDPELWGVEGGPDDWGVPLDMLGHMSNFQCLGARLIDERAQAETILRWGMEGPEPDCPVDSTRFAELVRQASTEAIVFMRALVPWSESVMAAARALDEATAAVAEGRAIVSGDGRPQRVSILEPDGANDA